MLEMILYIISFGVINLYDIGTIYPSPEVLENTVPPSVESNIPSILYVMSFGVINLFDIGTIYPELEQVSEILENTIPLIVESNIPLIVENIIPPILEGLNVGGDQVLSNIINSGNVVGEISVVGDVVQVRYEEFLYDGSIEEFKYAYENYLIYKGDCARYGFEDEAMVFTDYVR